MDKRAVEEEIAEKELIVTKLQKEIDKLRKILAIILEP